MTADTYDPILGLILQGDGNNNNSWGDVFNASGTTMIARAIAGVANHAVTGGTLDLSASPPPAGPSQMIDHVQYFTGALVGDQIVIVPLVPKTWIFVNGTTGGFGLFVKTPGGTLRQLPQGTATGIFCDGSTNVFRLDFNQIGALVQGGGTITGCLPCDGSSLARASFPDLFSVISTTWGAVDGAHFTLPLLSDTGRYLRSSYSGVPVGTYLLNTLKSHGHTMSGAPGKGSLGTDSQGAHVHNVYPGIESHTHGAPTTRFSGNNGSGAPIVFARLNLGSDNNDPSLPSPGGTGGGSPASGSIMSIRDTAGGGGTANQTASNGAHTHNITGAPDAGSLAVAASGDTETRPETAVVYMGIRY